MPVTLGGYSRAASSMIGMACAEGVASDRTDRVAGPGPSNRQL